MRVLTTEAMRNAEAAAVEKGISYERLMENAGEGAAHRLIQLAEKRGIEKQILFLCGRGNNAGDAFVAGRVLAGRGWRVQFLLLCPGPLSGLADLNLHRLPAAAEVLQNEEKACKDAPVICDAVFGIGFHGELPEGVREAFGWANRAAGFRVAFDIPSGLDPDTGACAEGTFIAEETITFGAYKPGLLAEAAKPVVGEVTCIEIGL